MDSDFMSNLSNMLKNGNIPDEIKEKMNSFMNSNSPSSKSSNENNTSQSVRTK